jgi:predicted phosphodiesterase
VVHDIGDVQPRSIEAHSIVVHGFTHQQEMKSRGDTLIVNPGEACGWLYGTPKAAILDLDTKKVEFISLDPAHWTT